MLYPDRVCWIPFLNIPAAMVQPGGRASPAVRDIPGVRAAGSGSEDVLCIYILS